MLEFEGSFVSEVAMSRVASQPTSGHHAFLACVAACQDCQPENLARGTATRGTEQVGEEVGQGRMGNWRLGRHLLLSTMRDSQITAAAGARY